MGRTHYEVLGVARQASSTEIEAAFRERTDEFRDHSYAGTDSLEDVREAYRILSNVVTRAGYDETLPRVVQPAKRASPLGWVKWALPFVLVAAVLGWIKWTQAPREVVMNVGPITRVPVESDDPTRPAPVVIEPAAPLDQPVAPPVAEAKRNDAAAVLAAALPSIARVQAMDIGGSPLNPGSGVVIGPGVIVTTCHVIKGSHDITVKVGRDEYRATPLAADEERDLCRLSVAGLGAPPVTLGNVGELKTGQRVFAIGSPLGVDVIAIEGIVTSLRPMTEGTVIQISAPVAPGASGGGLFDASGRLVGIVTFQHRFGQGLHFALPADWIEREPKQ